MKTETRGMDFTDRFSKRSILESVIDVIRNIRHDWEMEFSNPIGPATLLVADLKLESLHMVEMAVAIVVTIVVVTVVEVTVTFCSVE